MKQLLFGCLALSACSVYEENLGITRDVSARWAIAVGTHAEEVAHGVAIDSIGDVVAVGYQLPANRLSAGFVTKRVASDGSERWMATFQPITTGSVADVMSVAIAPGDAVLAAGYFQGRVNFAGTTLDASHPIPADGGDAYVAKLSSTGQLAWVSTVPNVDVRAIAIDHDGRFYTTGAFLGPVTIAGVTLATSSADKGGVLIAFDPDGVPLWGRVFTSSDPNGGAAGEGVTIASNGDVIVSGSFAGGYAFGGPVLHQPAGKRQASFLTRFRSDGLYLASSVVPQVRELEGQTRVALDPSGATVVTAFEQEPSSAENEVPAVHVLDDSQEELWTATLRGPIAFTSDGAMLTAQWIDDRPKGTGALELATVDASGFTWSTSLGTRLVNAARYSGLRAAAAGPDGGVALVGELTGAIGIGDIELAQAGGQLDIDALVIMIDP